MIDIITTIYFFAAIGIIIQIIKRIYFPSYNIDDNKISNELVIGFYNYKYPKLDTEKGGIRYFVESLRYFNKTCTIIVLMNTCPNEIKNFFNKNNVVYLLGFRGRWRPPPIMYRRFGIYYDIILKYKNFNKILMTDMVDVIFQGNPFDI